MTSRRCCAATAFCHERRRARPDRTGPGPDPRAASGRGPGGRDLHDFRHDPDRTGSVHAVRIDRVFAAQNRATATLADGTPVSVRTTRHDSLTAGGMAVITITAAPRETKPWQAVTGPRLAGPTLVLLPGQGGIAQSARMTSPPADIALDALQDCLDGAAGFGVILRRNAGAAGDLAGDAAALIAAWQAGQTGQREEDGPGCLFDPGGLAARIAVQSPHLEIEAVSTGNAEEFGARWDDMIATTTRADLPLAGGGVMWIEPTRALTAIDFDSGTGPPDALFCRCAARHCQPDSASSAWRADCCRSAACRAGHDAPSGRRAGGGACR